MRIKLWDVSWTGQRHGERDVATCLDLVTWAADQGYRIKKAETGTGTYNFFRGGVLMAVAEIGESDRVETAFGVARGRWTISSKSVQNIPRVKPTASPVPYGQIAGRIEAARENPPGAALDSENPRYTGLMASPQAPFVSPLWKGPQYAVREFTL